MKSNLRHCKKDLAKSMKNEEIMQLSKDAALEFKSCNKESMGKCSY